LNAARLTIIANTLRWKLQKIMLVSKANPKDQLNSNCLIDSKNIKCIPAI
jgi:hypothetical protein